MVMHLKYFFQIFLFFFLNNYSQSKSNTDYISGYMSLLYKHLFDNDIDEYKFPNLR